jgi:hypothetical protein
MGRASEPVSERPARRICGLYHCQEAKLSAEWSRKMSRRGIGQLSKHAGTGLPIVGRVGTLEAGS